MAALQQAEEPGITLAEIEYFERLDSTETEREDLILNKKYKVTLVLLASKV